MARTLDSIIQELDAGYNPTRQLINSKIDALPGEADAQVAGLEATQNNAFNDITNGARDRGIAFGGIPLAEQAKYTAGTYLPAVANVRKSQNDTKTSLLGALNDTNLDQRKTAMSIYQTELDREAQIAAANRAAAASGSGFDFSSLLGGDQPANGTTAAAGKSTQPLDAFLKAKIAAQPNAPRALQDQWVRQWAKATGKNEGDKTIWQAYDQILPWAQWNDSVRDPNQATKINWGSAAKAPLTGISNFVTKPGNGNLSTGNLMHTLRTIF